MDVAISTLTERLRRLETQEYTRLSVTEMHADAQTLTTTVDTEIRQAVAVVPPGLYTVRGEFIIRTDQVSSNDNNFNAFGELLVNKVAQQGKPKMKLYNYGGGVGVLGTIGYSWTVSLWDYRQTVLADAPWFFHRFNDIFTRGAASPSYGSDIAADTGANPRGLSTTSGFYVGQGVFPRQLSAIAFDMAGGDYSIYLDGATGWIAATSGSVSNTAQSLEIWFKTNTSGTIMMLIGNAILSTHRSGIALYIDSTGHVVGEVDSAAAQQALTTTVAYNDNNWHHAVFTYDATNLNLYIDGLINKTAAQTVTPANGTDLTIGYNNRDLTNYFGPGYLDEAAAYTTALTAQQVLDHYNAGNGFSTYPTSTYLATVRADTPNILWRLDDTIGSIAIDTMGAINGTYSGNRAQDFPGAILPDADGTYHPGVLFYGGNVSSGSVAGGSAAKPSGDMSIELWVMPDPTQNNNADIAGSYPVAANAGWFLQQNGAANNQYSFQVYVAGAYRSSGNFNLSTGKWSHLVCTYTSGTLNVYVNGTLVISIAITAGAITWDTTPVLVGDAYQGGGRSFAGGIDEFAIYAAVLTAVQVKNHYLAGRSTRGWLQLACYKDGGTAFSVLEYAKLVVTKLQPLARS